MKRAGKRHLTLLEVLIAFAIILLCIFPLISPHVFMLKAQSEFNQEVELDHAVNLLYVEMLAALQMNEIPWSDIVEGRTIDIDEALLKNTGTGRPFQFKGNYRFTLDDIKSNGDKSRSALLLNLIFSFVPKGMKGEEIEKKRRTFSYKVFLMRVVGGEEEALEPDLDGEE